MKFDNIWKEKAVHLAFLSVTVALLISNSLLIPVIAGAAIVAVKAGLGCRYSSVGKRAILAISLLYLAIATLLGYSLELVLDSIVQLMSYTLAFHAVIALLLLYAGYKTIRGFCCGFDVSRKTFLAISIPCPVCFGATLISCYFAAEALKISGIAVGFIVGAMIAFGIISISANKKENPERLGTIMVLLGAYYIFAMLLIPAVIQGMSFSYEVSESFSPYSLLLLIIFALGIVKGVKKYG
jgi:predicted transporter